MSRSCVIHAPCKINVHLEVGERRNDGYHNLRSIFLCLEFGDLLEFRELGPPTEGSPLGEAGGNDLETVTGMGEDLPPERNIVTKAVSLFREKTGYAKPLSIKLEKRAPLGGGLGGGSSDGASALIALNALAEADLSREDLAVMAEKLGSDVPFFLDGGAALVEGRGERIRPLEGPRAPLWVVLVNPGFPSGTGAAFAKLDAFRERTAQSAGGFTGFIPDNILTEEPSRWPRGNDFLPVLQEDGGNGEAYRRITGDLKSLGAELAGLSGTGSTCFGIFFEKGKAEKAEAVLLKRWNFVRLTFFLARSIKPVLQYD